MLSPITKISGISVDLIKPVNNNVSYRQLPLLNSLVEIKVIESSNNLARMLINGRVFNSTFPAAASIGNLFIGRVVNHNPFTISLNLAGIKNQFTENEIFYLIHKLKLKDSPLSRKIVKSFLTEKKPIEKSRLEELIEHLEKEGIDPDEQQLLILLRSSGNADLKEFITNTDNWVFKKPAENIAKEIFTSVKILLNQKSFPDLQKSVHECLILDLDDTDNLFNNFLSSRCCKLDKLLKALGGFYSTYLSDIITRDELLKLKDNIAQYRVMQDIYKAAGIFPNFLILKQNNNYQLFEYRFQKQGSSPDENNFKISIDLSPDKLGDIKINSIFSGKSLLIDFLSSQETIEKLKRNEDELEDSLEQKFNLQPVLKYTKDQNNNVSKNLEAVNVKV